MTTHQQISGMTDEYLLKRMLREDRFGDSFWNFFSSHVAERLDAKPTIVDLGCGPGLLLQDLGVRYPGASLYGYDITPLMIAHAQGLQFSDSIVTFEVRDIAAEPLPLPDGSVDLVMMSAVLHVLEDPLPVLLDIRRALKPQGGIFLLRDWVRTPLVKYLRSRLQDVSEDEAEQARLQWFRLFPVHNKYSLRDWKWLLRTAGFKLIAAEKATEYTVMMAFRPSPLPRSFLR